MNRCDPAGRRHWLGLLARLPWLAAAAAPIAAQTLNRRFPPQALRGELRVLQPPEIAIDGRPARLSPGARIQGPDNLLVMSAALVGQPLLVHYTLEPLGLVHQVWILSAAEVARGPWPRTPEQQATWRFDPQSQTWARP